MAAGSFSRCVVRFASILFPWRPKFAMILGLVGFAAPLVAIASASDAASNPALHAYGPAVVQPATSYFRHWAGAVSDMPGADAMAAEKARGPPVAEEIGDMLRRSSSDCGPGVPAPAEIGCSGGGFAWGMLF